MSDASQIPMLSPHGGSGAISIGNELWVVPTGHAAEAVASSEEDAAWQEAIGDLCYLMFSSGSTGVPKGIGMGSEAALRHVDSVIEWLGLTDHDRVFQFAQLSFDTSFEEIWPTLLGGATLVAAPEDILTFKRLTRSLRDHAVTTLQLPTAYWRKWIHALPAEDLDLPWLRQVIIGGEAAFARDAHLWQTGPLGAVPLINSYGPTEAGVTSTAHLVQACAQDSDEPLPIGQPLPGRILRFNERQEGTELLIGGPTLAKGYYADGRFSSDGFLVEGGQRWYRSGDLVASASSELVFVGRCDRQVKMLGHRVDLDSLEAALMVAGAREARVELVLGQDGRDRLVAVVAGAVEDRLIRRRMADHVPAAFVPSVFVRVDSLPLNSSGKIDATACRHLAEDIDVRGNANGILRSPFR